jgi:hypothetical protein
MAITYEWDVKTCDVYPSKSGKSNVVHNVHWTLTAEDDANQDADGNNITASAYGSQGLDTSDLSSFTNWSSLNASKVQGWVEAAIGAYEVTAMKARLDAQIGEIVSPSSVTKTLS